MDDQQAMKGKVLQELSQCVGREKAIDAGDLFERVFGEKWTNKISDTRPLRYLIRDLRKGGAPIGSCSQGYYLLRSDTELADYCRRVERNALGRLMLVSKIKKISLPQLLGQMQLNLTASQVLK